MPRFDEGLEANVIVWDGMLKGFSPTLRSQLSKTYLRNQLIDDLTVDVGEAEVAAGVAIGEFRVIEAQEL